MSVAEGLAMSRCQKPAQIDILTSDVKEGEWGEWRGKFLKRTWTQNFNPELVDLAFCFLCFCLIKGTEPLPEIGIDYNQNGDRCDHCCADRGIPKEEQQTNQKLFLKGFNFPSLILWSIHSIILVARWGRIPSGHKPFFKRIWLSDFFFFFDFLVPSVREQSVGRRTLLRVSKVSNTRVFWASALENKEGGNWDRVDK